MRAEKAEAHASTAHDGEGGRNLPGSGVGAEARSAAAGQTKPEASRLMEAVVERSNMLCAYERVVANEGAPGVDGLTVAELKAWLKAHWAKVRQALLAGEYIPQAVRKVEIYVTAFRARTGLHRDWPAYPAVPPLSASCSSGQRFAYSFLQIPSRDGHPCRSANTSPCRVCRGLSPPSECALPGAPKQRPA